MVSRSFLDQAEFSCYQHIITIIIIIYKVYGVVYVGIKLVCFGAQATFLDAVQK